MPSRLNTGSWKRKECEESYLRHWREKRFHVPEILASPFPEYGDVPPLSTTFVNGVTLKSLLQKGYSSSEKNLITLFTDMSKRHQLAFQTRDNFLFHVDANTRNILAANNLIVHVDFEMGRPWEAPMKAPARGSKYSFLWERI
jgi:thiamine kinase-like enzyme